MAVLRFTVETGAGQRLDRVCALRNPEITRSRLKNGARRVLVNGKESKLSRPVRVGDEVLVEWDDPVPGDILPEDIELRIIFENDDVTIVNKRQGMVTHPAAGNWSGTLVNALLWHWRRSAPDGNPRPGIVHRLDKDTSGLIITAKNPETEAFLQESFRKRAVTKVYAAILTRVPPSKRGEIRTNIVRDPGNRKRFTWTDKADKGKSAWTSYRVVKSWGNYALVLFRLHTGRTHQLRVHSKFIGCPILGDPVYGKRDALFPDATLMLHAGKLVITLPGDDGPTAFTAPLPARFKEVITALEKGNHR